MTQPTDRDGAAATPLLAATGVTVRFGGLTALDGVDIDVLPREVVGLVGPNGAGKSTLFGVLSGILRPSAGRVSMAGEDISRVSPKDRAGLGLSRTFQQPELFAALSVRDHLVLAYRLRRARSRLWRDIVLGRAWFGHDTEETRIVDEIISVLGLEGIADQPAIGLPLGLARLVEMGRALVSTPSVLLLDEPSSGLDSRETAALGALLKRVHAERGVALLLVEHDLELVRALAGRVLVLDFGLLIAAGTMDEVVADPAVRLAYVGDPK
jgi:ABC-type branched-subunit amino acid transport system ATPase component